MARMDRSESLACGYLESLGYRVRFEPDGNVPPDLLVNELIAVEVRRLNQTHEEEGRREGLENLDMRLFHALGNVFTSFGPPRHGISWFVNYSFGRPLPDVSILRSAVRNFLKGVAEAREPRTFGAKLFENFEIDVMPASKAHEWLFHHGNHSDDQSGGWVLSETEQHIRLYSEEKHRKVLPYRDRYPVWWLLLVDQIGYGSWDEFDQAQLRDLLHDMPRRFDEIVLVDPINGTRGFHLYGDRMFVDCSKSPLQSKLG